MQTVKFYELSCAREVLWCTHWHLRTKNGGYRGKEMNLPLETTLRMLKPIDGKTVQVEYQSARYTWYRVNLTLRVKEVLGKYFLLLEIEALDGFIPGSHDPDLYDFFRHGLGAQRPIQNWPSLLESRYLSNFSKDAILGIRTEEAHKAYICGENVLYPWATLKEQWIHEFSKWLHEEKRYYPTQVEQAKESLLNILDFLNIYNEGDNISVHALGKDNKGNLLKELTFIGSLEDYIKSDRSYRANLETLKKTGKNPYFFKSWGLEYQDKLFLYYIN